MKTKLGILLLSSVFLLGCETRTTSPWTGKQVTESEFMSEKFQREEEAKAEAQKLFSEAKLLAIQAQYDQEVNQAEAQAKMAKAEELADRAGKNLAVSLKSIQSQEARILEDFDRKNAQLGSGLTAAANVANSFGPVGGAVGGVLTAIAGVYTVRQRNRAQQAEAEAKSNEQMFSRIIDSIDLLKAKSPEVAKAFKKNKAELEAWQGEARTLLERLRA